MKKGDEIIRRPVNRLAAKGMNYGEYFSGLQSVSPLDYHKFKALAKSKNYRNQTPDLTHSQRMNRLATELGARDFRQYRVLMLELGVWKEKNGKERSQNEATKQSQVHLR